MKPPRYVLISPFLMLSIMAVVLVAGLAGCGGGASSSSAGASAPQSVTIKNFKYGPEDITVAKGTKVTFTNDDSTAHTATATDAEALETGTIEPGKSKTVTLEKPGTYRYFCAFHPFMKGEITITE